MESPIASQTLARLGTCDFFTSGKSGNQNQHGKYFCLFESGNQNQHGNFFLSLRVSETVFYCVLRF
jgi:hypothetical protein